MPVAKPPLVGVNSKELSNFVTCIGSLFDTIMFFAIILLNQNYLEIMHLRPPQPSSDNLNYGIIGNCKSSALINEDSSIDWSCLPQFDSPSVFGKILDDQKGVL